MEAVVEDKSVIRRKFSDLRRATARAGGAGLEHQLAVNLQRLLRDFGDVQCCLYQALPDEVPCLAGPPEKFFYPLIDGHELKFYRPTGAHAFRRNHLGFNEPVPELSAPWDREKPTVVCCPAVAIDSQGMRLGRGKGFYDRFFIQHPDVLRVGVIFHVQYSSQPLPAESWDQAMDWIVTEKMILRCSQPTRSPQSWM